MKRNIRRKKGFRTKKEALAYIPTLMQTTKKEKPVTFAQVFAAWEPTHRAGKSTMNCYRAAYKYFAPVWGENFREIDVDDLQSCMDDCEKGKRTKENMKALCGLLYKYAIPRHLCSLNLGQYLIVTAESAPGRKSLPLDALKRLHSMVGIIPYADYVVAQCYLGFRPSELLALEIGSYDSQQKTLTGGAKTEAGKNRVVPIASVIQPIIDRLTTGRTAGQIFCAKDGSDLSIEAYRNIFYSVLDAAEIDNPIEGDRHKYTPHSCRHTFATLLKNVKGSDKDKLSLIGHTSTEMLRHYQDSDLDSMRAIIECIGV